MNKQNEMKVIDTDSRLMGTRTEGSCGWVKTLKKMTGKKYPYKIKKGKSIS